MKRLRWVSRRQFLQSTGVAAAMATGSALAKAADVGVVNDVTWKRGPKLPRPVKGQAQGVMDGRIIYSCGFAFDTSGYDRPPATATRDVVNRARSPRTIRYCRETWLFEPETQKFEQLPDAPVGVFWPEGLAVGDDFYLLTGAMRNPIGKLVPRDWQKTEKRDLTSPRIFRLRKTSGTWSCSELPSMRFGRFLPGVAAVGSTLYVIGGQSNFGAAAVSGDVAGPHINAVESLDLSQPESGWRDVAPLPGMARENCAVAVAGGKIYVFGGFSYPLYHKPQVSRLSGAAYRYDPQSRRWEQLPDMPFAIEGAPAVTVDGSQILIFAGIRGGGSDVAASLVIDQSGGARANLETIVFDIHSQRYRLLPSKLPPAPDDPVQPQNSPDPASKLKNYWCLPRAGLIGDTVYLLGSEVLDLAYSNCSDATWIGTIERGESS